MRRAVATLCVAAFGATAGEPALARAAGECERGDLACFQSLYASECEQPAATLEACLVFLQRLETARRGSSSSGLALLLGDTLRGLARRDVPPEAKDRYLARSRAAYRQAVKTEPFDAAGYLGLAEVAETGEERVDWLRGAVRAEYQPVHMELLANALSTEIGGHTGDLEAARVLEDAYTYETTNTEKWRYGASAWRGYTDAAELYPAAISERALENVVLRIQDDIDYTADLPGRVGALIAAIGLSPNRGDLRLKAGATYVELELWPEALEQLRTAKILLPPEEHARVDELAAAADERYQARFWPRCAALECAEAE